MTEKTDWLARGVPAWMVLVEKWKTIFSWTFAVMVVAVAVALLWPKTYRAVCTVLVTPPRYAANLVLSPPPLDVKTGKTLADSYDVLQRTVSTVLRQRDLVFQVREKLTKDPNADHLWPQIALMKPEEAADLLGMELTDSFTKMWEDLPSAPLLPGYLEFEEDEFEDIDPLVLSKFFDSWIGTILETNVNVQYQPILSLSAEWRTERTAAILAHCWARSFLEVFEREYLKQALASQSGILEEVTAAKTNLQDMVAAVRDFEATSEIRIKAFERDAILEDLHTGPPEGVSLLARKDQLEREIESTEGELKDLREQIASLEKDGVWIGVADKETVEEILETARSKELKDASASLAGQTRVLVDKRKMNEARQAVFAIGGDSVEAEFFRAELEAAYLKAETAFEVHKAHYLDLRQRLNERTAQYVLAEQELDTVLSMVSQLTKQTEDLDIEVNAAQTKLDDLNRQKWKTVQQYNYILGAKGGVEALSEDYTEAVRIHNLGVPTYPKRKVRPRRSVIVLAAGAVAFLALCGWVLVSSEYRQIRRRQQTV